MNHKNEQAIIRQNLPVSPLAKKVLNIINLDKSFLPTYYNKIVIDCLGIDEPITIEEEPVDFLYRSNLAHINPSEFTVTVKNVGREIHVIVRPMSLEEYYATIPLDVEIEIFNKYGKLIMNKNNVHDINAIVEEYDCITNFTVTKEGKYVYIDLLDVENDKVQTPSKARLETVLIDPINKKYGVTLVDIYELDLPPEVEEKLLNNSIRTIKQLKELPFGELLKIANIYDVQTITMALESRGV